MSWRDMTMDQVREDAVIVAERLMKQANHDLKQLHGVYKFEFFEGGEYQFEAVGLATMDKQHLVVTVRFLPQSHCDNHALSIVVNEIIQYIACEWCDDDAISIRITETLNPVKGVYGDDSTFTITGELLELM